jgi:hypothetical protein
VTAARAWQTKLIGAGLLIAAAIGIADFRRSLTILTMQLREKTDVYDLPSPEQVVVMSLGYRSALADLLFAHVLVWHGIHFQERRRLEFAADYLDTVAALDPSFRETYYFGDTLITMQPVKPRHEDYVRARQLLEKGLKARPLDTELWLSAGQYIAYVAAPWLADEKEQAEWRLAGARVLARACELVGSNENIPYNCIGAAGLFTKAGEREASIEFLERVLAVSDDETIRERALAYLDSALGERAEERLKERSNRLRDAWKADLPFITLTAELVLTPPFSPAACAGLGNRRADCATSWAAWRARERDLWPAH